MGIHQDYVRAELREHREAVGNRFGNYAEVISLPRSIRADLPDDADRPLADDVPLQPLRFIGCLFAADAAIEDVEDVALVPLAQGALETLRVTMSPSPAVVDQPMATILIAAVPAKRSDRANIRGWKAVGFTGMAVVEGASAMRGPRKCHSVWRASTTIGLRMRNSCEALRMLPVLGRQIQSVIEPKCGLPRRSWEIRRSIRNVRSVPSEPTLTPTTSTRSLRIRRPRFRCQHTRQPVRSRLSAADLVPDTATAGRRIRAFTEGANHHRHEGPTHCILCVVIVDKCCPLGFL